MRTLVALVAAVLVSTLAPAPAGAATAVPTILGLTVPSGRSDTVRLVRLALVDDTGAPVAGATVTVQRRVDGVWRPLAQVLTDEDGAAAARAELSRVPSDNVFRASYAGDATYAASRAPRERARLVRRDGKVTLRVPDQVVDERRVTARLRWRTGDGTPVAGGRILLQRREDGAWRTIRRLTADDEGRATTRLRPREDVRLRGRVLALPWVTGDRGERSDVDNLPPAEPVRLPAGAPSPRLDPPDQPRPTTKGPHVVVTRIPDGVWRSMVGRSWHRGCPVGRPGLRLVRANYFDYSGYRRRGELVVAAGATGQFAGALRDLYEHRIPMRSMYRVDRWGWSDRVRGADDYASMSAGNTSAFNCRDVVGNPGTRSPHAWGRAFDINTWENPYHSAQGTVPNTWWAGRSHPRVAWRSGSHVVVRILRSHGFSWTYGTHDSQHFDARTGAGRVVARCATVCH